MNNMCKIIFLTKKPSITLIYMTCKRIILFGIRFIWSKWSLTIRKRYFRRKNYMVTKKSVSKELINRVFGDKWLYSLSPARTFALDSVNHKEQQHNITIRVSMRRRRSRIGRQGGIEWQQSLIWLWQHFGLGKFITICLLLSQIHSYLGELMYKIQFRYLSSIVPLQNLLHYIPRKTHVVFFSFFILCLMNFFCDFT